MKPLATAEQVDLAAGWERWRKESIDTHGSLSAEEEKRWQAYLQWRKGFRFPDDDKQSAERTGNQQVQQHVEGAAGHATQRRLLQVDGNAQHSADAQQVGDGWRRSLRVCGLKASAVKGGCNETLV